MVHASVPFAAIIDRRKINQPLHRRLDKTCAVASIV